MFILLFKSHVLIALILCLLNVEHVAFAACGWSTQPLVDAVVHTQRDIFSSGGRGDLGL